MTDIPKNLQFLDRITMSGIEVYGYHGVYPEENETGQRFIVDVDLFLDTTRAGSSDQLADTVDYSVAAQKIVDVLSGQPNALLERISARLADDLLQMTGVKVVRLCLHKPDAPIAAPKDDVTLTIWRGLENIHAKSVSSQSHDDGAWIAPSTSRRVVIALGGNLGDVPVTMLEAIKALNAGSGVNVVKVSPLVRTKPVLESGAASQPDYYNAVIVVDTLLSPLALLERLQAIEVRYGRVRKTKWGARTLDLDMIAYQGVACSRRNLTLPHPRAAARAFVMLPWSYLESQAELPGYGLVRDLLQLCSDYNGVLGIYRDWWEHPQHLGQPELPLPLLYHSPQGEQTQQLSETGTGTLPLFETIAKREQAQIVDDLDQPEQVADGVGVQVSEQCKNDSAVLSAFADRIGSEGSPLFSDLLTDRVRQVDHDLQEQAKRARWKEAREKISKSGPPRLFRDIAAYAPVQLNQPFLSELADEQGPMYSEQSASDMLPADEVDALADELADAPSSSPASATSWQAYEDKEQIAFERRRRQAEAWRPPSLEHFESAKPARFMSRSAQRAASAASATDEQGSAVKSRADGKPRAAEQSRVAGARAAQRQSSSVRPATSLSPASSNNTPITSLSDKQVSPELAKVWAGLADAKDVLPQPVTGKQIFPSFEYFRENEEAFQEAHKQAIQAQASATAADAPDPSSADAPAAPSADAPDPSSVEAESPTHSTSSVLPVVTAFDPHTGIVPKLAQVPLLEASESELSERAQTIIEEQDLTTPRRRSVLRPAPSGVTSVATGEIPLVTRVQGSTRTVPMPADQLQDSAQLPKVYPAREDKA